MFRRNLLPAACAPFLSSLVHAHEGHGMPGPSHWHAGDVSLWVVVVVVAVALWHKLRK